MSVKTLRTATITRSDLDLEEAPSGAAVFPGSGLTRSKVATILIITLFSSILLRALEAMMDHYPDSVAFPFNPFNPAAHTVQAFKVTTYLELVFGLSAMFSTSVLLCLRMMVDSASFSSRPESSRFVVHQRQVYWISLHWKVSLLLAYFCISLQCLLLGWIATTSWLQEL